MLYDAIPRQDGARGGMRCALLGKQWRRRSLYTRNILTFLIPAGGF